jgi:hypothetical protein
MNCFYQVINSTLNMGMASVPEMLDDFHTLTRLSDVEDFIEFCRHESFRTSIFWYTLLRVAVGNGSYILGSFAKQSYKNARVSYVCPPVLSESIQEL